MASSVSLYRGSDPYETLISSIIMLEREPQYKLKEEKIEKARLRGVIGDGDSKISALHNLLKRFNDRLTNTFTGRAATLPDQTHFSVSASDTSAYGSHSLKVEQLASVDTRISKQISAAGTSLRALFDANNGTQTFHINVASPADGAAQHRDPIEVTIAPEGATDEEILKEIAGAINSAMDGAVSAGTVKKGEKAHASVVTTTTGEVRLSLRSGQTGYANRLEFTDDPNGNLLSLLEVTNTSIATGTGGGAVKAVGTSETDSALNSRFVLDGLTLYRSSNQITDALEGTTLTLKQVGTAETEFSIEPDSDKIKKEVEEFITKYNDILSFIQNKSKIDGTNKTRGDLANDTAFTSLRFGMRSEVIKEVSGQPADGPSTLSDLGIVVANDGKLSLKDSGKLLSAVKKDSAAVQSFFAGTDGIAQRLQSRLDSYVGINGLLANRKKSFDETLKRIDKRIASWDERLLRREEQLRQQFAQMQQSVSLLQGQQMNLASMLGY